VSSLSSSEASVFAYMEIRDVCLKMQTVLGQDYDVSCGRKATGGIPHLTLLKWSEHIRFNFDLVNLDIVPRTDVSGSQLVA
jgi:hypothetical protein